VSIDADLLALFADELNVKAVEVIADGSALVDRRVKPLLPRIGKRLGSAIPAVMTAARSGEFEILSDGSVRLGGETLAPDEVEIQATPRPGTAVAEHDGIVVVLDTELTPDLRAEGDAREIQRAVQDLRRDAGLELDDRIDLWIGGVDGAVSRHLPSVAEETLGVLVPGEPPADATSGEVRLEDGVARIGLRRRPGGQDR
jgi:isoleucyl-tRNA synthetase